MSLHELHHQAAAAPAPAGFAAALKAASVSGYGLIAELKKASPSKGLIRADFDIPTLARAYADGGASCLSVLTDKHYFQGDDAFLMAARTVSSLPVLRKDFMIDPVQIVHSRALGADCILLIMAALSDAHDSTELDRAIQLTSPLMGINNRNLKTMEISLQVGLDMLPRLPKDRIAIAESGLFTADDLALMAATGARCFLIGESLMRSDDVTSATAALLANPVPA